MTRTAAEVADGLLVMPFHTERHIRERTLPAVAEGLRLGGRERMEIQPQIIAALGDTPEELDLATEGVRRLLAFYASTPAYRPVLEVEGWADLQPELNALSKRGDVDAMAALVTDDMVDVLAVRGSSEDCAAEIGRRFGDFAERVCCYFPGQTVGSDQLARLTRELAQHA